MIKIKTSELSSFFKRASSIKSSDFLPIYTYLKFECQKDTAKIYKSNGHAFIIHDIEVDSTEKKSFLIEEKMIRALVEKTNAKEITFEIKASRKIEHEKEVTVDNISFSDGLNKMKCQSPVHTIFTPIPAIKKEDQIVLPATVVESLFLAKSVSKTKESIKTWMAYVHINEVSKNNHFIVGMADGIMYFKKFNLELPSMILEPETCSTIGMYGEMNYSKSDNYHVFDVGITVFGFIHLETVSKAPDITVVTNQFDDKINFIIDRKELIGYCEICLSIRPGILQPIISLTDGGKNKMVFKYENIESERSNERVFDVKKAGKPDDFLFLAEQMVDVLKNLSFETVQFSGPIKQSYFITSEEDADYIGAIRAIVYDERVQTVATK